MGMNSGVAMAEEVTYRWMQDEEEGSMERCRARRVSGVVSAVALGSGEFLAANSLRRLQCEQGM